MIYGSVCSGIEAASVAWHPLGWRASFLSEIDAFPRAVLKHHYQDVPLHGDFTTIRQGDYEPIDVLVGGTPCQSFSVAGLRGGLADERGNLALEYIRLAQRLRPRWLVWENVPGVLSSGAGRDFGSFLGGLVECGYGFAYRVLDAQYFGLAQRRKRVFVVGYLGDWRRAAAVLFEPESLRGHPAPRRETGERVAPTVEAGANRTGGTRPLGSTVDTADSLVSHTLRAEGHDASEDGTGRGVPLVAFQANSSFAGDITADLSPTMRAQKNGGSGMPAIAFGWQNSSHQGISASEDHAPTLDKSKTPAIAFGVGECSGTLRANPGSGFRSNGSPVEGCVATSSAVRRLTPRECERLQGFPDNWTLVPYRGKPAADGPRYKALGNSMAVPVMSWIGRRIAEVHP